MLSRELNKVLFLRAQNSTVVNLCRCAPAMLLLLAAQSWAVDSPPINAAEASKPKSKWVFSLLPKSLQSKPELDFHVITEMTADGKKLSPPSATKPAYYLVQPGTFKQLGSNTPGNEHAPPLDHLTEAMQRALAANHYLPATPATPLPGIVVVFNYGSFARFSTDADDFQQMVAMQQVSDAAVAADPNAAPMDPLILPGGERSVGALLHIVLGDPTARKDVLQRAELIGGSRFTKGLEEALNQEASYEQARGAGPQSENDMSSPFYHWANANENVMSLVEESFSSCYYVVASAYDYVAMKHGQKKLLWRTKMTVNSSGISMTESLAPLIAIAAPYFGKDMVDSATISHRISRDGKVEIGTATVINDQATAAPPATPPTRK